MAFDVFISYASKDKVIADAVCARLEASGTRSWIAPRDLTPGTSYGEAIIEAIHGAKVMVLVFSSHANSSGHIPKEVERAVSSGVSIIPFRIEDVAPGKSLDYFIGSVHWLDAMTPPMEKHLDDLAATVHKLLPVKAGEQGLPSADISAIWSRSATGVAPAGAARAATSGEPARVAPPVPSMRMIWIGVAAVVVMAAVIIGLVLMRNGENSPGTNNPSDSAAPAVPSNSPNVAPASQTPLASTGADVSSAIPASPKKTPAKSALPKSTADPIVGCYQWFNHTTVTIASDGSVIDGPFTAHWQLVSAESREYLIRWPKATDTVTIARMQKNLKGANQFGFPVLGTRLEGGNGLVGTWRWTNGVRLTVSPDGTFSAATFHGTWRGVDATRGIYALTWPEPVDSITLSSDGSHVSGQNQYGVAVSGTKTEPCAGK